MTQEITTTPPPALEGGSLTPRDAPKVTSNWRPIETAAKDRTLLLGYRNRLGNWRTVVGSYYAAGTLESDYEESGFAPEGWYEESQTQDHIMPTDEEPTHWQPMPAPPTAEDAQPSIERGEAPPSPPPQEGLVEALEWALDEIDVLANRLVQWAYPQAMPMIGREDQFESYRAARTALSHHRAGVKPVDAGGAVQ